MWLISKKKLLIIKGAGQVGKFWLLAEFAKNKLKDNHHIFNFERYLKLNEIFQDSLVPKNIITKLSFF